MKKEERVEALKKLKVLQAKQNEIAKCTARILNKNDQGRHSINKGTHK